LRDEVDEDREVRGVGSMTAVARLTVRVRVEREVVLVADVAVVCKLAIVDERCE
jgi:hypothetical protein